MVSQFSIFGYKVNNDGDEPEEAGAAAAATYEAEGGVTERGGGLSNRERVNSIRLLRSEAPGTEVETAMYNLCH